MGWAGDGAELAGDDLDVVAPPNHLRGVSVYAAYATSALDQIDGPVWSSASRPVAPS